MRASDEEPEDWAFWTLWMVGAAAVLGIVLGVLLSVLVGIVAFAAGCAVAVAWVVAHRSPDRRLRTAELEGLATEPGEHAPCVLLVANAALDEPALDEALHGAGDGVHLDVLAPVLQSRTHMLTTDVRAETAAAQRRLDATLRCARRRGLDVSGRVGDPIDPLAGLQDELRLHAISEVVVATHPDAEESWLEPEMLDELRAQLDIPVRRVVVAG